MNLAEITREEREIFVKYSKKATKMFKPKMKELRNNPLYKGLYLIGTYEAPYEKMSFSIGTERDYERMFAKKEDKIMVGGFI